MNRRPDEEPPVGREALTMLLADYFETSWPKYLSAIFL